MLSCFGLVLRLMPGRDFSGTWEWFILFKFSDESLLDADLGLSQACTPQIWAQVLFELKHRIQKSSPAPSLGFFCLLHSPSACRNCFFFFGSQLERWCFFGNSIACEAIAIALTSAHIWVKPMGKEKPRKFTPSMGHFFIPLPNLLAFQSLQVDAFCISAWAFHYNKQA